MKYFIIFFFCIVAVTTVMAQGSSYATCYSNDDCNRMCYRRCDLNTVGVCSNYICYCALVNPSLPPPLPGPLLSSRP